MKTRLVLERNDRKIVAYSEQDVEPILDRNKALQSEPQRSDWGRHIGTIPLVLLNKWLNEEYAHGNVNLKLFDADFNRIVKMKLDDPDYRYLRTDK